MIQLIAEPFHGAFSQTLAAMHRLRHRVFKQRLDWSVHSSGEMETDEFDALGPVYLVQTSVEGLVQGSVRLLPTTGPTMIRDTFSVLLGKCPAPSDPHVWESSRFAVDLPSDAPKAAHGLARATYELFAGMIEFGLSRQLTSIVTVTDVRMERILRRAGWPLRRIASPCEIGNTLAVAGHLEITLNALDRIRAAGGLAGPVLWTPVLSHAA
ncbi:MULTISPECIES: acyl-homoserine-lactone synthase [Bradyrhizobium]|uniref:acyl-homoserine-lactone synthase n=3 Tax=Bradyrhizobium TaxID=374 RepID=A0A410VHS6_9BRAD|nr:MULTISPECIES: acyl-homoserine-lactone synthase [Bradyrhizobium]MCG2632812.1 acyl-homoserine-lactone synthase [Bradyrhizobium zhengyangense]MCG2645467.1 acyl-homoserine-lactone synthase [Bradyrhizobium zhengyangense]MCG2672905.1 acyl-homoserine-lactone synthase [Bradyrhizobium zhengyangense]MDN4988679.1 acyl-homoserine-lactone synthase [Bradyrhizobium sp. WYCCWR 13022]MDN5006260.1 acyl-homoserine-lactone synthase [Bradyrhizobium sp. WYCCWR 12677]